ncbi:MAG TPA: oligosaccharide flippase family protein [Flavisolibacter sp.]|nr:oligosaccharide flippase family protein [Flavisolibacter sp.]
MSGIKKLAGQTLWYGGSSIAARFLNYLLTPYLTYQMATNAYGEMSILYAAIPFLNVIFTYGLETAYFRYATTKEQHDQVYNTATISLIFSTSIFTILLVLFNQEFATLLRIPAHPEYFTYSALIIGFDALTTLAFAKLRYEGRPVKFASVRIAGIIINIASVFFFLSVCPKLYKANPHSYIHAFYNPDYKVGYVIIANLIQSVATFLLLSKEFFSFKWQFNGKLWKEIILYSSPLILAGFAGMINETFDRIMLGWWSSAPTLIEKKAEVGIYSACYKLSILITLFIQAFRMGAEPFFFKQAQGQQPQKVYARVMKFFVIVICFMFLIVALFLDIWKYFIDQNYWGGLKVVPILLLANMFLGIYYNLSIWYKLSNRTMAGAWITLIGAFITLGINYTFIPSFGYLACAWATFLCYGSMMVVSYIWGQKNYRVPYAWKKLVAYIVISVALYGVYELFNSFDLGVWTNRVFALILLSLFGLLILNVEKKEFQRLPYVGRFFTPKTT